ncbi:uncharacterized protein LOC113464564 [Ceratina calcarata]|uniref:Uncharacterized protein LOC113464564 n=1 Tax=Ceratina calcarata TaxID=156304 RepID=A0AAJ7S4G6_9HYME|nr:uncharacterized protein LOC113464564 [Ceratina calcarata]
MRVQGESAVLFSRHEPKKKKWNLHWNDVANGWKRKYYGQSERKKADSGGTIDKENRGGRTERIASFTPKNDSPSVNEDTPGELDKEDDVELAKTGFYRSGERFGRQCGGTKKIDDRFRSMMLTQISPQSFRIVDAANVPGPLSLVIMATAFIASAGMTLLNSRMHDVSTIQ